MLLLSGRCKINVSLPQVILTVEVITETYVNVKSPLVWVPEK